MSSIAPTKSLCIVVPSAEPGYDLISTKIEPGVTAIEALAKLNLDGFILVPPNSARHLQGDEILWPHVVDGGKLLAVQYAPLGG